jgi:TldD protein
LKKIALEALDAAKGSGAEYADVRLIEERAQDVVTRNGRVGAIQDQERAGIGIRVLSKGAWGFASTADLSRDAVHAAARKALAIADASSLARRGDLRLAPVEPHVESWTTPAEKDPFAVPLSEKIDLLLAVDAIARRVKGITTVEGSLNAVRESKLFLSTIGSDILQVRTRTGAGFNAAAFRDGELQDRSYPASFGGQYSLRGWELVTELDLPGHAEEIAGQAVALLDAPQCPSGETDLILESSQLALQVHESIGHPIELDRVLGSEANYAGMSFLTPEKHRNFRYGSKAMNVVADATWAHGPGLGSFAYDDEGVPGQRNEIVREGAFVGYMTSRETAPVIGEARSNGCMRAESYNRVPLIRMTNVSILPGHGTLDDILADTKDGIYMSTVRSWSIDDKRYNFQFGPEIAWEVKNGKRGRMLKNPSYGGITPEFWATLDWIAGPEQWVLWGVPNCGKGQPGQVMGTGHGASPARFRKVRVGVAFH